MSNLLPPNQWKSISLPIIVTGFIRKLDEFVTLRLIEVESNQCSQGGGDDMAQFKIRLEYVEISRKAQDYLIIN